MYHEPKIPEDPDWPQRVADTAVDLARRHESCSQSVLAAFMDELGIDDPMLIRAAGAMHGGMLSSKTCGVVTAGMMVLGVLTGRERLEDGVDGLMSVVLPGQSLMRRLEIRLGSTSCRELTGVDFTDLSQAMSFMTSGDHERCFDAIGSGTKEIAALLQEMSRSGQLFRFEGKRSDAAAARGATP